MSSSALRAIDGGRAPALRQPVEGPASVRLDEGTVYRGTARLELGTVTFSGRRVAGVPQKPRCTGPVVHRTVPVHRVLSIAWLGDEGQAA